MRSLERLGKGHTCTCNLLPRDVDQCDGVDQVDCARRNDVGRSAILAAGRNNAFYNCILLTDLDGLAGTEALDALNLECFGTREDSGRKNSSSGSADFLDCSHFVAEVKLRAGFEACYA